MLAKYKDTGDMFIVDLDKQRILLDNSEKGDCLLPELVVKGFKIDFCNLAQRNIKESDEKNLNIQRCFMQIFIKTISSYENFIVPNCDANKEENNFKFMVNLT
jgi:hypothetical protein